MGLKGNIDLWMAVCLPENQGSRKIFSHILIWLEAHTTFSGLTQFIEMWFCKCFTLGWNPLPLLLKWLRGLLTGVCRIKILAQIFAQKSRPLNTIENRLECQQFTEFASFWASPIQRLDISIWLEQPLGHFHPFSWRGFQHCGSSGYGWSPRAELRQIVCPTTVVREERWSHFIISSMDLQWLGGWKKTGNLEKHGKNGKTWLEANDFDIAKSPFFQFAWITELTNDVCFDGLGFQILTLAA